MNNPVFEEIVAQSGLSPLFARNALERALRRAGVNRAQMKRADVAPALPEIERTLLTFLPRDAVEVLEKIRRIGG